MGELFCIPDKLALEFLSIIGVAFYSKDSEVRRSKWREILLKIEKGSFIQKFLDDPIIAITDDPFAAFGMGVVALYVICVTLSILSVVFGKATVTSGWSIGGDFGGSDSGDSGGGGE